jgi:hypothetical protein
MQALAERFGYDKVVLAGLLSADEVHVNSSLEGYNFVGKSKHQITTMSGFGSFCFSACLVPDCKNVGSLPC